MGKKGKTGRLKRNPSPKFWPIHRKEYPWVVKPASGPHSLENCLPLTLILRDILGVAKTKKEATKILSQGKVSIDGKVRRKANFPVGLMDIISIHDLNEHFRVMPSHKGLVLQSINKEEAAFKLARVEGKRTLSEGVQVSLHDGSNILVKVVDITNPTEATYQTFDVLKLGLPDKEVISRLVTQEGNMAVITGGKNIGKRGKIVEIEKTEAKKRRTALVVIEDEKSERYQTILDYVFSIGEAQPLISEETAVV